VRHLAANRNRFFEKRREATRVAETSTNYLTTVYSDEFLSILMTVSTPDLTTTEIHAVKLGWLTLFK